MGLATDIKSTVDYTSGVDLNYRKVTTWYDGSAMNSTKKDNDIYNEDSEGIFWKKQIDTKTILKINTIADLRNQNGYYIGQEVTLMGYYASGDKDPLNYIWKLGQGVDDDGYVINTSKGRWEAVVFNRIKPEDYGAKGDGTFDDGVAFQKALNFMKQGYALVVGAKDYRTSVPLVMNSNYYQTIEGCAYTSGSGQGGVKSVIRTLPSFPNDAYILTTSPKSNIKYIGLTGGLSINAINHLVSDINLDHVVTNIIKIGLNIKESYYSSLNKVEFRNTLKSIIVDYCFNLSIFKCTLNGGNKAFRGNLDHIGIDVINTSSNINIINSSLENYWGANSHAIVVRATGSTISLIGTYFEGYGETSADKCLSAILVTAAKVNININNSYAYIYNQDNFVDLSQASNFVMMSKGNSFRGSVTEECNIYKLNSDLNTLFSSSLDIGVDDFSSISGSSFVNYVSPKNSDGNMVYLNSYIQPPVFNTKDADNVHVFNGRNTVNRALNSEPSIKKKNTLYFANTSSWLPDGYSDFAQAPVIYDGTKFISLLQNKELKTITTTATLNVNSNNLIDPSANITVTLPAAPRNNDFVFIKVTNKAFNVTIDRNWKSIEQATNNIVITSLDYIMLVFNSYANTWYIKYRKMIKSAAVGDVSSPDANDLSTALTLVNELKAKLNAKLLADRNSGQQLT